MSSLTLKISTGTNLLKINVPQLQRWVSTVKNGTVTMTTNTTARHWLTNNINQFLRCMERKTPLFQRFLLVLPQRCCLETQPLQPQNTSSTSGTTSCGTI
eukprot:PhF_6_TR36143/c2_g1_i2/m.52521